MESQLYQSNFSNVLDCCLPIVVIGILFQLVSLKTMICKFRTLRSKVYIWTNCKSGNKLTQSILIHTRVVSNFETGICILMFDTSTGSALEMQEAKALLISDDWLSFETRFSGYSLPLEINISSTELSSSMYT